ncbi:MAG: hypothetical protein GEV11_02375 [Streptosporangiales bacterium]|nr:hypothetical protein [Streptosporangiales bacterium]
MTGSRPLKLVHVDDVQRTDAAIEELASRRGEAGRISDPALSILDELIADVDEREPVLRAVGSQGSARRTRRSRRGRFIAALGIGVVIAGGSTGVAVAGSQFLGDLQPPRVESIHKGGDDEENEKSSREIGAGVVPPIGGANGERPPQVSRQRSDALEEARRRAERAEGAPAEVPSAEGKGLDKKVDRSAKGGKLGADVDTGLDADTGTDTGTDPDTGTDSDTGTDFDTGTDSKGSGSDKGRGHQSADPGGTTTDPGETPDSGTPEDSTTSDDGTTDDGTSDGTSTSAEFSTGDTVGLGG